MSANTKNSWKADFPIFESQPDLVYLDSAATSFKPRDVIDAMNEYYTTYSANVHRGLYDLSVRATDKYEAARKIVAEFIKAKSEREIIFTRGATEAINLVAQSYGDRHLKDGDEIILSIFEHHSNIVPWQMLAKKKNLILKYVDIDENGELKTEQLTKLITRRTKLISISHVSNALGTITSLRPIIQKVHAVNAKILVDAAQSVPHMPIDVQYLDCDFLVFSGHKMCGPTGIGVLYAKEKILNDMEPVFGGGDMILEVHKERSTWNALPWKFEAGTPPIAEAIGLGAAIQYLQKIGMNHVRDHEKKLTTSALEMFKKYPEVKVFGPADASKQAGVISFTIAGIHPHDIAEVLNGENIAIRAGHHCCMPLMERLKVPATARVSFYLYNEEKDIERLEGGIKKVIQMFK